MAGDVDNDGDDDLVITGPVRGRTYVVRATTYASNATGNYTLSVVASVLVPAGNDAGQLEGRDGERPTRPGRFADDVVLVPASTKSVTIQLNSSAFDAYPEARDPSTGALLGANDDCGGTVNSCLTLSVNERWPIVLRGGSYSRASGGYSLTVD